MAAVYGLVVLRPRKGGEANATKMVRERLEADPYSTEYSIVKDNITTLAGIRSRVEVMAGRLLMGYLLLLLAWISTVLMAWFNFVHWI